MKTPFFILFIAFCGFIFAQNPVAPFKRGEKITYRVHYGFIDAGEATIEVDKETNFAGKPVYHIIGNGRSLGTFNYFYKVRDRYESYIDERTFLPIYFLRRTDEGGYIINQDYVFNRYNNTVKSKRSGSDAKRNGDSIYNVQENMHDILSAFYYARSLDNTKFDVGKEVSLNTFFDEEHFPMKFKVIGRETIKTKLGKVKCFKVRPILQKGRVFKNEEDLTLWVSDDANRIPIRMQANVLVGSIKMDIKQVENLRYPLAFEK